MWMRAIGTWMLLAAAMVANGAFRALVLAPRMGTAAAEAVSVLMAIGWILLLTRPYLRSLAFAGPRTRAGIAALWVGMTMVFEAGAGRWVAGASGRELLAAYDVTAGSLWPLVLLALAAAPFLWHPGESATPRRPAHGVLGLHRGG